ncbi:hypothetical protein PT2222_110075 [Paraburkholderia tropica]
MRSAAATGARSASAVEHAARLAVSAVSAASADTAAVNNSALATRDETGGTDVDGIVKSMKGKRSGGNIDVMIGSTPLVNRARNVHSSSGN